MRALFLSVLLLFLLAVPVDSQVCSPEAAPDIATLFPEAVDGVDGQFYRAQAGCHTHIYRGGTPWAVVSIEPNLDAFLGETAQGLVRHYEHTGTDYILHEDWPVARLGQGELGEEFVTLRGAVRITVLVKEAPDADASEATARTFLEAIFQRVPCVLGTY